MPSTRVVWFGCLLALALTGCPPVSSDLGGGAGPGDARVMDRAIVLLRTQASDPDPSTRANCIEALQLAPDPRALEAIEQGLHDPEWVVRFASAMAAGRRKEASLAPTVRSMVNSDANESVRVACVYALNQLGDMVHMNLLAATFDSPDPSVRANTAMALGMIGEPTAKLLLAAHHEDPDNRVRFEITAALARLGDSAAQDIITSWAISRYAEDQWGAMMVCGDLPETIAGRPLLLGLQDFPRLPADPRFAQLSTAEIRDLTTRRQLVAARSLAKLRSLEGSKVVVDNLSNSNASLRAQAVLDLGDFLVPSGTSRLERALGDSDPGVRRAAAAAIVNVFVRALPHH